MATGPVARYLAEAIACGILRTGRAERLEGELLAGLAQGGTGLAKSLHDDKDARASLALVLRYRREADGEVRRALDSLLRLQRARAEGLLPDDEDALAAQERLDAEFAAAPAPNEPSTPKIEPVQPLAAKPANWNAPAPLPAVLLPDGRRLLQGYYWDELGGGPGPGLARPAHPLGADDPGCRPGARAGARLEATPRRLVHTEDAGAGGSVNGSPCRPRRDGAARGVPTCCPLLAVFALHPLSQGRGGLRRLPGTAGVPRRCARRTRISCQMPISSTAMSVKPNSQGISLLADIRSSSMGRV